MARRRNISRRNLGQIRNDRIKPKPGTSQRPPVLGSPQNRDDSRTQVQCMQPSELGEQWDNYFPGYGMCVGGLPMGGYNYTWYRYS